MISRRLASAVEAALARQPAVGLVGLRQTGKTTLALAISAARDSVYLDLENARDRAQVAEPQEFLDFHRDRLVVLDEVHQAPEIFRELRGAIDRGRRSGRRTGRYLLLGSASASLLRQTQSLAGRLAPLELGPFDVLEAARDGEAERVLWLRGGLPESFLAEDDPTSLEWREDFLTSILARDLPQFGVFVAHEKMRRLWTMLAHRQGGLWSGAAIAAGLGMDTRTVNRYLGLLVDLLFVRRLPPYAANLGKRSVKSPKVYIRDSGLAHALLGIGEYPALLGHPVVGGSWEGFVIENLIAAAPRGTAASFYRTSHGAECGLVLELPGRPRPWAIEVKRGAAPRLSRGFHSAAADLSPERAFLVYPGDTRFPLSPGVEAIGLRELAAAVSRSDPPAPATPGARARAGRAPRARGGRREDDERRAIAGRSPRGG